MIMNQSHLGDPQVHVVQAERVEYAPVVVADAK